MSLMATTGEIEAELRELSRRQAELAAEVERLKETLGEAHDEPRAGEPVSPSVPLDAPHPSAKLVIPDDAYDALVERLEAPPNPNERLRRTMSLHPLPKE